MRVYVAATMAFGLALVLALAGCDSQPDPTSSSSASGSQASRKSAANGGDPDMVSAFSGTHGDPGLVNLKFKLTRRPAVGEPVEIALELIPTVELERLFARFQVAEGLQLVAGAETEHFEHPARGVPVNHRITVTPKMDGIFYVTAIVLADSEKESVARNFSFPLIAGQGLTELPDAPTASATVADSTGTAAQP